MVCTRGSLCCLALSSLSDAFQTHGAAARKVQRIPRTLHSESPNVNTRHLCFLSTPPPTHRHTCMHPHTHPCASHLLVCGHRATAGPTGRAQGGVIMQKGDFWLQTPKGWVGLVRSGLPGADTRALGRSTHSARSGQPRPAALLLAVTATTRATVNSIGPALPPTSSTPTLSPPWEVDGAPRGASGASGRSVASQVTRPAVIKSRLPVPNTHVGGYNADHFADSDHHCCYTYDTPTAALGQSHTPFLSLPPPQAWGPASTCRRGQRAQGTARAPPTLPEVQQTRLSSVSHAFTPAGLQQGPSRPRQPQASHAVSPASWLRKVTWNLHLLNQEK